MTAPTGASVYYQVYRKLNSVSYSKIYQGSGRTYLDTLSIPNLYVYRVRACVNDGSERCSDYRTSNELHARPPVGNPVISLTSLNYSGDYTVSWTTPTITTEFKLSEKFNDGAWKIISNQQSESFPSPGTRNYDVTNRGSGQYSYKVQACNRLGCNTSSEKHIDVAHKPGVPTSITQVSSDMKNTNISWGKSSGTVSHYIVEQSKNGGSYNQVYKGKNITHEVTGLTAGKYTSRVKACYQVGAAVQQCSTPWAISSEITLVLLPTSIEAPAIDNDGIYTITFTKPSNGDSVTYQWQERLNSGAWSQTISTTSMNVSQAKKENGSWSYRVKACELTLCSGYTSEKTVVVLLIPGTPPSLETPTENVGISTVKWGKSSNMVPSAYYKLSRKRAAGSYTKVYEGIETSFRDTTTSASGTHTYEIKACIKSDAKEYCSEGRTTTTSRKNTQTQKRVIYIHSDLLGSPAAETDENGEIL
ncbi:chitinase N-terminal domain-containing protein [Colwellia sp. E2M01]|uniref:chitinase N-terminal domain-containing protein n=1 Tax=Colwellia sp. E2M01 TaxID=2841561 RepID=UPI001C0A2017|nr:chitinase N-terminal domain-containing protein [Colwellia sp. E2M01]MBU2870415.1 hypothetical protein [Colwellia sp. E2M01]